MLTVDAEGLLQFHMRTGGLIHAANANHSHPVTALGVGQVRACRCGAASRAISCSGVRQGTLGLLQWYSAVQRPNSFAIATGDANGDVKVHSVATAPRQARIPQGPASIGGQR